MYYYATSENAIVLMRAQVRYMRLRVLIESPPVVYDIFVLLTRIYWYDETICTVPGTYAYLLYLVPE